MIQEATKKVVLEYAYHEKQHQPSEKEHEEWVKRKSEAKKRYYDSQKKDDDKKSDSKAIDYYDYKHGKGNFPVMYKESKLDRLVGKSMRRAINEMMLPDECGGVSETRLDYDMDNFSGRWNRGTRYDILVDGYTEFHDVPEEAIDRCYDEIERKYRDWGEEMPKIEVVEL